MSSGMPIACVVFQTTNVVNNLDDLDALDQNAAVPQAPLRQSDAGHSRHAQTKLRVWKVQPGTAISIVMCGGRGEAITVSTAWKAVPEERV